MTTTIQPLFRASEVQALEASHYLHSLHAEAIRTFV